MKRLISLLLLNLSCLLTPAAHAQSMVSVSMGQPGFYGRIDIGNGYPQPTTVPPSNYPQDMEPTPAAPPQTNRYGRPTGQIVPTAGTKVAAPATARRRR